MSDTLQIFLRDVHVLLRVGYYHSEHAQPQPIIISLLVSLQTLPDYRAIDNDLSQLLDYATLHDYLTQSLPQQPHMPFLETLAEHIIQHCWQDARVTHCRVEIQKPTIFLAIPHTGIILERSR